MILFIYFQALALLSFFSLGTVLLRWSYEPQYKKYYQQFGNDTPLIKIRVPADMNVFDHYSDKLTSLSAKDLENIIVENEERCKHVPLLVYDCSSSFCGGWGDRQKGMVTAFLLALLTKRHFVVQITKPCDIENFLEPALYNWKVCKQYINQGLQPNETLQQRGILREVARMDFETEWNKRIVIIHLNAYGMEKIKLHKYAKERVGWLFDRTNPEIIRMILQALFKPRANLQNEINNFVNSKTENGQTLVCTHIRIGQNPSIPRDSKLPTNMFANVSEIFSFLKQYDDGAKYVIYIATDSDDVRQKAFETFANYVNVNRRIVHVDNFKNIQNETEICDGFNTVLFEHYLLSTCDRLIITRSNFGATAAYLRGRSDNLFLYHTYINQVIKTNLTNIQVVYHFV